MAVKIKFDSQATTIPAEVKEVAFKLKRWRSVRTNCRNKYANLPNNLLCSENDEKQSKRQ